MISRRVMVIGLVASPIAAKLAPIIEPKIPTATDLMLKYQSTLGRTMEHGMFIG